VTAQTNASAASPGSAGRVRTVLITGAAEGLGRDLALGFAAQGDRVVGADLNARGARATVALIEADGGTARAVGVDVTVLNSARAMAITAADFSSENGGERQIDVVINAAAIRAALTAAPFTVLDVDEWERVMAVNLKGPWLVTRACSRFLPDGGKVINLVSAAGVSGFAHREAADGGVIALTRALAWELGERGITVNAIAAGFTVAEAGDGLIGAALFLAGPGSKDITGQTLVADGGRQLS